MITSLYRELAKQSAAVEGEKKKSKLTSMFDPMQQGFGSAFAKKPPDFTKLEDMMLEYEYEHL